MTIWNSTCNPCFSTFDKKNYASWIKNSFFFFYSLKLNFICYRNRFFTFDYSLWDGGRHTFLRAKTNFNLNFKLVRIIYTLREKKKVYKHVVESYIIYLKIIIQRD